MNYKIKNDIKNNMVVVSVTVEKRLSDKQKRIKVRASHVEEYLNKNYNHITRHRNHYKIFN